MLVLWGSPVKPEGGHWRREVHDCSCGKLRTLRKAVEKGCFNIYDFDSLMVMLRNVDINFSDISRMF